MQIKLLVLSILLLASHMAFAAPVCVLPDRAGRFISSRYPGWQLLQVSDLVSDDQALWTKVHGLECPGLVEGHFMGVRQSSTVVAIISKKLNKEVILLFPALNGKPLTVLSPAKGTELVLHRLPSGKYNEFDGTKSLVTRWDGIDIEKIEAGEMLRYWNGRYFQTVYLDE